MGIAYAHGHHTLVYNILVYPYAQVLGNALEKDGKPASTYSYFNVKGESIGTFESKLTCMGGSEEYLIMSGSAYDATTLSTVAKFYKFVITK